MRDVNTFRLGQPHPELFPLESLVQASEELLSQGQAASLTYGEIQGNSALREEILARYSSYYPEFSTDQLMLTYGVTDAISFAARALLKPADVVVVEAPTYHWALPEFLSLGAQIIQIPVDEDGMDVDLLEAELERARRNGLRTRLIYSMPTFQNPTGTTLSLSRRVRLLEIARRFQAVILEDDPYFQLRYRGRELPPLVSLDRDGVVIHAGTFSKVIAPGVRLGWVLTRSLELMRSLLYLKPNGTNPFVAATLVNYLRGGNFERHVEKLRQYYQHSYEICSAALAKLRRLGIPASNPDGGFYFWLRLPAEWSAVGFTAHCKARGLEVFCGDEFFALAPREPCVRLAFSAFTHDELADQLTQFCTVAEDYSRLMQSQQSYASTRSGT
jgi:2-aminoadipate transaminase